ncbi:MAG TPA: hypothetical protein VGK05_07765 [Acidimicrobiia bacterium]
MAPAAQKPAASKKAAATRTTRKKDGASTKARKTTKTTKKQKTQAKQPAAKGKRATKPGKPAPKKVQKATKKPKALRPAPKRTKALKAAKVPAETAAAKKAPARGAPAKKAPLARKEAPAKKGAAPTPPAKKAAPARGAPAKKAPAAKKAPVLPPAKKAPPRKPGSVICPLSGWEVMPAKPNLSERTLKRLRAKLIDERNQQLRQAEELQAEAEELAQERDPGDTQFDEESGEGDTVNVERERDLLLSASARQIVDAIDRALARMEAGTYGVCVPAGRRLSLERLEAIPYAEECVDCKARAERRR